MNHVVTLTTARSVETPAADMRTYVSPSTEIRTDLALWRTQMGPGVSGPAHAVDTDHVVVVLEGSLRADVAGEDLHVGPGECVVLPADTDRRLTAGPDGVTTLTAARPGSSARAGDAEPVTIPWAN